MEIIKDDELIYVNDNKTGINSCGYNVKSLLFNSGISPIKTLNENKKKNSTFSSLFNNLVVPNWALHYEPNNSNKVSNLDDNSTFEIIDDNLYDKLMDLAIYKDPFFNNMTAGKCKKHNKTKHKLPKNIDALNKNKNQKKKHKKTRKK